MMATGAEASVQSLCRTAIEPVNDGGRCGRSRMVMSMVHVMMMIGRRRKKECMVLLLI